MSKQSQKSLPRQQSATMARPAQFNHHFSQDGMDRQVAAILDYSPLTPLASDEDGWLIAWRRRLEAAKLAALEDHAVSKSQPPESVRGIEMVGVQEAAVTTVLLTAENARFFQENEQKSNEPVMAEQDRSGECDGEMADAVASLLTAFGVSATAGPSPERVIAILNELAAAINKVAVELHLTHEELHAGLSNLVNDVEQHAAQIVTMLFVRSLLPLIGAAPSGISATPSANRNRRRWT